MKFNIFDQNIFYLYKLITYLKIYFDQIGKAVFVFSIEYMLFRSLKRKVQKEKDIFILTSVQVCGNKKLLSWSNELSEAT